MIWSDAKHECFCEEILLFEQFKNTPRTKEIGTKWKLIADSLNQIIFENFRFYQFRRDFE